MNSLQIPSLLLIPLVGAVVCLALASPGRILGWVIGIAAAYSIVAAAVAARVLSAGAVTSAGGWLRIDALSAYHLAVLSAVFLLSSVFARVYFQVEAERGEFPPARARQFGALWLGALGAITLVLVSNNLGFMWVGLEATTLTTAFLISLHRTPASLEAMWKYLVMCSVGVAFAFMGTLLVAASARGSAQDATDTLLWTSLIEHATSLSPAPVKAAFIFLLVGYGTKAGLAPLHSWLPDAHSQAPAPVSAMFSGFLLNAALYCILRYVPLVEAATGASGWAHTILMQFGVLSILVAAVFIVLQGDLKRLLAYHSVEHLGIISLGLGVGGIGTFAALFHVLNHSLCKTLGFFCAGRLGQIFGTHEMEKMSGTVRRAPVWGVGLFGSFLALIGMAPFSLFMSEFQILKGAMDRHFYISAGLFLLGATIVFTGALRHAISMAWGGNSTAPGEQKQGAWNNILVYGPLAVLLALGLWMPEPLRDWLDQAARLVEGVP
ncbi:MAG: hydrogenase 4 subunit F [Nitrospirae bacterium]|nr:hydrogenase 4 subunit F [Nitrospirota bacterium]